MLILLSPVALAVSLAVWGFCGRPILFRQLRAGVGERPFSIMKFRTMSDVTRPGETGALEVSRITTLGRFLRKSSLDEIPQLFSVLKGEMSLVGPRPLPMAYIPRYHAAERRRHLAKPGITGWAQVNGRNTLDWDRRLELDIWYVDHWSFALDLKILAMTARDVLLMRNTGSRSGPVMEEFRPTPRG